MPLAPCHFCGHPFDEACGRYGCPNCHGEGLADEPRTDTMTTPEATAISAFQAYLDDPRRKPANTLGAVDHDTGRVCVSVAAFAASPLNDGDTPAYWYSADAASFGMDPWALVEGVDTHVGTSKLFDVWFASGQCKTVGLDGVFYVAAQHADALAQAGGA